MTESSPNVPKIIVAAESEVYDLLSASGVSWDLQHRVDSISQMWDDISGGRLDQGSRALIFSDSVYAAEGELEATLAVMAPAAATFLVVWDVERVEDLLAGVRDAAEQQGVDPNAPIYVLSPASKQGLLDGIRDVFAATGVAAQWPGEYATDVEGPVTVAEQPEPVWEPGAAAPAPALAPVAPVATPVAPVPAPVAPVAAPVAPVAPVMPAPGVAPTVTSSQEDPLSRPPLPGQATFAVTSSKGGSGKSTTAMMLAAQIAASSRLAAEQGLIERPLKVVLVDMDTRDGQVASLIARYIPTALNIRVQPQWDEETILNHLVKDPKLGIDALLAPVRPRTADDVGPDFYRHVIRVLQRTHDVVIMDTSVNYLDPLISTVCLPEATAVLFVTTLATTSVQGMARALREITEPVTNGGMGINRQKIGIVVNQSVTDVGMDRDQVLQAALKVNIVGAIPLATRDVLTATNFNRMHLLLKHPLLGPAYYRLATKCLPNVPLVPVVEEAAAQQQAPSPAPVAQADPHANDASKKRGLLGRRKETR